MGGLILGWTVSEPDVRFRLVDDRGAVVSLGDAARWTRNDIIDAMSGDFGDYAFNAGFLQKWSGRLNMGGRIRLIAIHRRSILPAVGDRNGRPRRSIR